MTPPVPVPAEPSSNGAAAQPSPEAGQRVPGWLKLLVGVFAVVILTGAGLFVSVAGSALQATRESQSPLDVVLHFGDPLQTDSEGRTNILLLGSGGKNWNEGTDLTDSIMVASVDERANRVTLISIPRDLYVQIPGFGWARVNTVWPYAEKHAPDPAGGAISPLPKDIFSQITGLDIQYVMKVDFRGFTRFVDALGGVELIVERSFVDTQYPNETFGYKTVRFEAGPTKLTGAKALEFVRSRHAAGPEGSDIARSRRQQQVIQAVRDRLTSSDILEDRSRIEDLVQVVNDHYLTDITFGQLLTLAKIGKRLPADGIVSLVISHEGRGALLTEPTAEERATLYGGSAVLIPKGGSYTAIHRFIRQVLADPSVVLAPPRVVVLNGTKVPGLATRMKAVIETDRFQVVKTSNAASREYTDSVVVDISGKHAKEAERIAGLVGARVGALPEGEAVPEGTDLLVVLGAIPTDAP